MSKDELTKLMEKVREEVNELDYEIGNLPQRKKVAYLRKQLQTATKKILEFREKAKNDKKLSLALNQLTLAFIHPKLRLFTWLPAMIHCCKRDLQFDLMNLLWAGVFGNTFPEEKREDFNNRFGESSSK